MASKAETSGANSFARPPAWDRRRFEVVKEAVPVPTLAEDLNGEELRKVGERWRGKCALCGNGSNSGAFSANAKLWNCFFCGEGGDVVKLAALANDMPPAMAAAWIADRYGIEIPQRPPSYFAKQGRQKTIRDRIDETQIEHIRDIIFALVWKPWLRRLPEWSRGPAFESAWKESLPLARMLYESRRGRVDE